MDAKSEAVLVTGSHFLTTRRFAIAAFLALLNACVGFFMAVLAMTTNGLSGFQIYAIMAAGLLLVLGSSAYAFWSIASGRVHWGFGLVGQILALPIFVAVVLVIFDLKTTQQ